LKARPPVSIENLLEKSDNSIYKLVILASRRALELNEGSQKLVDTDSKRISTIALEEIVEGKIGMKEKKK